MVRVGPQRRGRTKYDLLQAWLDENADSLQSRGTLAKHELLLAEWCHDQRKAFVKGNLKSQRVALLEELPD